MSISHLLPSTPPYLIFFNNIINYLRVFNYIFNVENDNVLRSHNFLPYFSSMNYDSHLCPHLLLIHAITQFFIV